MKFGCCWGSGWVDVALPLTLFGFLWMFDSIFGPNLNARGNVNVIFQAGNID